MNYKHGLSGKNRTKAYLAWKKMMWRCYGKPRPEIQMYRILKITVCERWHDPRNFVFDMGEPPEGRSLDRIDTTKGYYKENCRWATRLEQENNKTTSVFITFEGFTKTRAEWSRILIYPKHRKTFTDRLYFKYMSFVRAAMVRPLKVYNSMMKQRKLEDIENIMENQDRIKESLGLEK